MIERMHTVEKHQLFANETEGLVVVTRVSNPKYHDCNIYCNYCNNLDFLVLNTGRIHNMTVGTFLFRFKHQITNVNVEFEE